MANFLPAPFSLYEFDNAGLARSSAGAERRWFGGWNGLVGAPAEDVSLGWAADGAVVVVRTAGHSVDDAEARFLAAHVALGGTALPLPRRPESGAGTFREMAHLKDTASWFEVPGLLPDAEPAQAVAGDGFAVSYARFGRGTVFLAATGVRPDQFRVREVQDWGAYDLDARTSFPLSELNK